MGWKYQTYINWDTLWKRYVRVCVREAQQKLTAQTWQTFKAWIKVKLYRHLSVYSKYKHDNTLLQPFLLIPNTHHVFFWLSPSLSLFFFPPLQQRWHSWSHIETRSGGMEGGQRWQECVCVCVCLAHLWGQKHHFVKLCRRPSLTLTALEKSRVLVSPCAAPNSADPHLPPPPRPPSPTFSCPCSPPPPVRQFCITRIPHEKLELCPKTSSGHRCSEVDLCVYVCVFLCA